MRAVSRPSGRALLPWLARLPSSSQRGAGAACGPARTKPARGALLCPAERRLCSHSASDEAAAVDFIIERGYAPEISRGIVKSLADPNGWGARPGELLSIAKQLAGRWEVGEDAGLASLAAAVEREMAAELGKAKVTVRVFPPSGERPFDVIGLEGQSLREVVTFSDDLGARLLSEYLECACSGVMACSTCHVYVSSKFWDATGRDAHKIGPPSEEEEDMLDLAYERRDTSRLGCQIILSPKIDGLEVEIPPGVNNLFDADGI